MALYAFDGTGNEDKDGEGLDSNVLHFFRAYPDPNKNDDTDNPTGSLYLKGIGTRAKFKLFNDAAKAFGLGGHRRIRQAMKRLERNMAAGDNRIDIVGFSRGAALAISFANEIADEHKGVKINFVGVFDIVGQFGAPGDDVNAGHDLDFPDNVEHCYHAMAMDEERKLFPLTRLTGSGNNETGRLTEVWFRGVHSDVGGGNDNQTLNYIALDWMYEQANKHGLNIPQSEIDKNLARKQTPVVVKGHKIDVGPKRKFLPNDVLHTSVSFDPAQTTDKDGLNNPKIVLARSASAGAAGSSGD